jgi:hypothetical protein
MSFLPASRTKRRLLKVASLGLAGLLVGLLSGCNNATASTSYTHVAADSQLPPSIEATQIPALRHPPSSRSLQYGSVRTVSMAANGRNRS